MMAVMRPASKARMMEDEIHLVAVQLFQVFLVGDLLGRLETDDLAVEQEELVHLVGHDVDVMRDEQDGQAALTVEFGQEGVELFLGGEIHARRRFVQDEDPGVAGERPGDHHSLPFAAREVVDELVAEPAHFGDFHGRLHRLPVGRRERVE